MKKARKLPIARSNGINSQTMEITHLGLFSMSTPSFGGRFYGLVLTDDFTAKSYIYFSGAHCQLFAAIKKQIAKSGRSIEKALQIFRMDRAGEHRR